jgi:hypothetical protein
MRDTTAISVAVSTSPKITHPNTEITEAYSKYILKLLELFAYWHQPTLAVHRACINVVQIVDDVSTILSRMPASADGKLRDCIILIMIM